MKDINRWVNKFREALDIARVAGEFDKDCSFNKFPSGCCGDVSDLLAQFFVGIWYQNVLCMWFV